MKTVIIDRFRIEILAEYPFVFTMEIGSSVEFKDYNGVIQRKTVKNCILNIPENRMEIILEL